MIKYFVLHTLFFYAFYVTQAQKIARFETILKEHDSALSIPVSISLDNLSFEPDSSLVLLEVNGNKRSPVPFQISGGNHRCLNWLITGPGSKNRMYELVHGTAQNSPLMQAGLHEGVLTIHCGNQNFLQYSYKTVYPPPGIDSVFKRGAFIHPVWTPHGQVITNIQPPDHYHHYGIFNPWTHVLFEGDTVDFWNLSKRQGTIRFGKFVSVNEGPVYAEFKALHEHVVLHDKSGHEKVALNELQTVRVYKTKPGQKFYIIDIIIDLNCATESPFRILEYRYGGFGWRATGKWNKTNVNVLTSEGKNRQESDSSKARWVIVQGELDNDYGGAMLMSYPTNYNHPEPLRIWPETAAGGTGQMFTNFSPTKDRDWLLLPGKTYTLKYRLLVFNDHFNKVQAEQAWQSYAHPPQLRITK